MYLTLFKSNKPIKMCGKIYFLMCYISMLLNTDE